MMFFPAIALIPSALPALGLSLLATSAGIYSVSKFKDLTDSWSITDIQNYFDEFDTTQTTINAEHASVRENLFAQTVSASEQIPVVNDVVVPDNITKVAEKVAVSPVATATFLDIIKDASNAQIEAKNNTNELLDEQIKHLVKANEFYKSISESLKEVTTQLQAKNEIAYQSVVLQNELLAEKKIMISLLETQLPVIAKALVQANTNAIEARQQVQATSNQAIAVTNQIAAPNVTVTNEVAVPSVTVTNEVAVPTVNNNIDFSGVEAKLDGIKTNLDAVSTNATSQKTYVDKKLNTDVIDSRTGTTKKAVDWETMLFAERASDLQGVNQTEITANDWAIHDINMNPTNELDLNGLPLSNPFAGLIKKLTDDPEYLELIASVRQSEG